MTKINRSNNVDAKGSILDRPLRILHAEDNPDDRHIVERWLTNQNIAMEFTWVDTEADFMAALDEEDFDIVLSDKSMPGFDGLVALNFVREKFPHIPFVFVTGSMGEESAIDTIKNGATDYVLKDRLSRLIPALQRAIREAEQEEKHRRAEDQNRQQAALLDHAQDAILVTDEEGRITYWNKGAERVYGWPASAAIGAKVTALLPIDSKQYEEAKHLVLIQGSWAGELLATNRGGNPVNIEGHWTLMRDGQGNPLCILMIDTDITERKAIETRFLRSQRMDSIGALAGGIAHDLNNALAPVLMSVELLKAGLDDAERDKFLDIISVNSRRATELVKQILSFARGSGGQRGPVKIRELINEMGRMIRETFPKSIGFTGNVPAKELWRIRGDPTELHQVILNLCVNARDAMPQGGRLALSAQNFVLDATSAAAAGAKPGSYVRISVADTGTGIPPEVLPRIFEPFFTTKKGSEGTGLGLATVVGIVKNHDGFIEVETEAGKGTEFKVYFPALDSAETKDAQTPDTVLPTGKGELILVIDDEETLLELTKTMLESFGYKVLTAPNGLEGIALFKERQQDIRLIITDSDMPHLDGVGTVRAIRKITRDLPIIMASGSKRDADKLEDSETLGMSDLGKPYRLDQLLTAVAASLGCPAK